MIQRSTQNQEKLYVEKLPMSWETDVLCNRATADWSDTKIHPKCVCNYVE